MLMVLVVVVANGGYDRGSKSVDVGGASGSRPRVGVGNIGAKRSYIGGGRGGGSNDKGNGGSEEEGDGNNKNEGDGRSDDEDYDDEAEGGNREDYDDEVQVEIEGGEDDEEVTAQHNRRGYSLGLFGTPPYDPYLIRMAYFNFDPKYGTKNDAREALNRHMRRNMRKTLCNERKRIKKISVKNGGSFLDHRPRYYSEAVWKPICDHWDSPAFQKKSDAAKEAREHRKIPHTSGAISFQRRAWDIKKKTALPPTSGKGRRRRSINDESSASTGRSVIEHIVDQLVMQAMDRTVAFSRAHPDQFDLALEQVNMLAQSVAEGASDLPSDHPLTMTTTRELVQVMESVLGDICGSTRPPRNCNKMTSSTSEVRYIKR
ncbi:hypothetical protein POM88_029012 [Heracleum sosnowskyi]|uniref:Uncharacterized protein n=1 Tax=Heracleum sosnowskyi TaxID=360622 RepID=A0AAD8HSV6_9APIA|nr:hypothetical protein POM88_029012 [Heracleum sosnowskyi]